MRPVRPQTVEAGVDGKAYSKLTRGLKITCIALASILLGTSMLFAAAYVSSMQLSFPITVLNMNSKENKGVGISISESYDFTEPTSRLNALVPDDLNNISAFDLPKDIDGNQHTGSHNGTDYVAYTFYLKSSVESSQIVYESININNVSRNADAAVRIRVYRDGKEVTYAKKSNSGMSEYGTTPFSSEESVCENKITLEQNQIIRYTIVVWLEGDDPDCTNDIMGGFVGFSMEFEAQAADDDSSAKD